MSTTAAVCDAPGMQRDLLCQMKRHEILPFSQRNRRADETFLNGETRAKLRAVCDQRLAELGPGWTGDNVRSAESWLQQGPTWLREMLCVPRCCNIASLMIFMVVDLVVYAVVVWFVERYTNHLLRRKQLARQQRIAADAAAAAAAGNPPPPPPPEEEEGMSTTVAMLLQFWLVLVLSTVVGTLVFTLARKWLPFVEEPAFVVTFAINLYTMFAIWTVQWTYQALGASINPNPWIYDPE